MAAREVESDWETVEGDEWETVGDTEQVDVKLDWNPTLEGFGRNVLTSAGKFAGDIGQGVLALPGLAVSAVKTAGKGQYLPMAEAAYEAAKGIPEYINQRYGSGEAFLNTLYTDPVGALTDLSTVLSGAGALVKGVGTAGKLSKVAQAGKTLTRGATMLDPIAQTGRAIRAPAASLGRKLGTPEWLMESALKPQAGKTGNVKAPEKVAALLQEEIPVGSGVGVGKAQKIIDQMKATVDEMLAGIPEGSTWDPVEGAAEAEVQAQKKYRGRSGQAEDFRKIGKAVDVHLESHTAPKTPAETQRFKTATYDAVEEAKWNQTADAYTEFEKQVALQAKDQLERWVPGIELVNERMGGMIEVMPDLIAAARRAARGQLLGVGTPAAAGLGFATGGPKGAIVAATLKAALDQPEFKSKLAIAINRAQGLKSGRLTGKLTPLGTAQRIINPQTGEQRELRDGQWVPVQ